jgi:hypothetical protein
MFVKKPRVSDAYDLSFYGSLHANQPDKETFSTKIFNERINVTNERNKYRNGVSGSSRQELYRTAACLLTDP